MASASVHNLKKIISLIDLYTTSVYFSSNCEDGVACVATYLLFLFFHHRRITFPLLIHCEVYYVYTEAGVYDSLRISYSKPSTICDVIVSSQIPKAQNSSNRTLRLIR